ncbi:hypothetical protein [Parasitella parasitica]|uniref:Uncharacterized protein n=1 Tax=Parasitella parasitica TaxID=35722 RepID=A0A0B7NUW8_9FUNG|nr:hypothetical protein [Parasitella parasitica]
MTRNGRLIHFLLKDAGTNLYSYISSDNNGKTESPGQRRRLDKIRKEFFDRYPGAHRIWKQSGESVTDENLSFDKALEAVCAGFKELREFMGTRRTGPAFPMETLDETPLNWKKADEIDVDKEDIKQIDISLDTDEASVSQTWLVLFSGSSASQGSSSSASVSSSSSSLLSGPVHHPPKVVGKKKRLLDEIDAVVGETSVMKDLLRRKLLKRGSNIKTTLKGNNFAAVAGEYTLLSRTTSSYPSFSSSSSAFSPCSLSSLYPSLRLHLHLRLRICSRPRPRLQLPPEEAC